MIRLAITGLAEMFLVAISSIAEAAVKVSIAKLEGTWTLVGVTNTSADGKTNQTYGEGDGMLVMDRSGHFILPSIAALVPRARGAKSLRRRPSPRAALPEAPPLPRTGLLVCLSRASCP
jgi:hypothetical protein